MDERWVGIPKFVSRVDLRGREMGRMLKFASRVDLCLREMDRIPKFKSRVSRPLWTCLCGSCYSVVDRTTENRVS